MVDIVQDCGLAPKTFFVAPDPSVVSEDFLESAFFNGYESYSLSEEIGGNIKRRVGVLLDTFPETLVFFTIDRRGDLKFWGEFLGSLQLSRNERSRIGVLYNKPESASLDKKIKQLFLFDIGIQGGCIPLHYSVKRNHSLLLSVLSANQAEGRRKLIRMNCGPSFKVNFLRDDEKVEGVMVDLSVSHFSAYFDGGDPDWSVGTKIGNIQLSLTGVLLMVNVRVMSKRQVGALLVYVFFFNSKDAVAGIDELLKLKVNQFIFQRFQKQTKAVLDERFRTAENEG